MNDNTAELATLYVLHGLPHRPNRCCCGSDTPFVDGHNLNGSRGPFFVWCAVCTRSGPERPTYDLALAAWNRATPAPYPGECC